MQRAHLTTICREGEAICREGEAKFREGEAKFREPRPPACETRSSFLKTVSFMSHYLIICVVLESISSPARMAREFTS